MGLTLSSPAEEGGRDPRQHGGDEKAVAPDPDAAACDPPAEEIRGAQGTGAPSHTPQRRSYAAALASSAQVPGPGPVPAVVPQAPAQAQAQTQTQAQPKLEEDTGAASGKGMPPPALNFAGTRLQRACEDDGSEIRRKKTKLEVASKECTRIRSFLYVGGEEVAADRALLERHGITHIINCCRHTRCYFEHADGPDKPSPFAYTHLLLADHAKEDIASSFWQALDVIERVRCDPKGDKRVLVHCKQGVSRSCTIAILHLMLRSSCGGEAGEAERDGGLAGDYLSAFNLVKRHRTVCNPNAGFVGQLTAWTKRRAAPTTSTRLYYLARCARLPTPPPESCTGCTRLPTPPVVMPVLDSVGTAGADNSTNFARPALALLDPRGCFLIWVPEPAEVAVAAEARTEPASGSASGSGSESGTGMEVEGGGKGGQGTPVKVSAAPEAAGSRRRGRMHCWVGRDCVAPRALLELSTREACRCLCSYDAVETQGEVQFVTQSKEPDEFWRCVERGNGDDPMPKALYDEVWGSTSAATASFCPSAISEGDGAASTSAAGSVGGVEGEGDERGAAGAADEGRTRVWYWDSSAVDAVAAAQEHGQAPEWESFSAPEEDDFEPSWLVACAHGTEAYVWIGKAVEARMQPCKSAGTDDAETVEQFATRMVHAADLVPKCKPVLVVREGEDNDTSNAFFDAICEA